MGRRRADIPLSLLHKARKSGWTIAELRREAIRLEIGEYSIPTYRDRLAEAGIVLSSQYRPLTKEQRERNRERSRVYAGRHYETKAVPQESKTHTRPCLKCEQVKTMPRDRRLCDPCFKENQEERPGLYGVYGPFRRQRAATR